MSRMTKQEIFLARAQSHSCPEVVSGVKKTQIVIKHWPAFFNKVNVLGDMKWG